MQPGFAVKVLLCVVFIEVLQSMFGDNAAYWVVAGIVAVLYAADFIDKIAKESQL